MTINNNNNINDFIHVYYIQSMKVFLCRQIVAIKTMRNHYKQNYKFI